MSYNMNICDCFWETGVNNNGIGANNNQYYISDTSKKLTIQYGTGKIGISTDTPISIMEDGIEDNIKLDINGSINLSGNIYKNGNLLYLSDSINNFDGNYNSLTNVPNLSIYSTFSGNYSDLLGLPDLYNISYTDMNVINVLIGTLGNDLTWNYETNKINVIRTSQWISSEQPYNYYINYTSGTVGINALIVDTSYKLFVEGDVFFNSCLINALDNNSTNIYMWARYNINNINNNSYHDKNDNIYIHYLKDYVYNNPINLPNNIIHFFTEKRRYRVLFWKKIIWIIWTPI